MPMHWSITATGARNISPFATPSGWPKPVASPQWAAVATAATMRWQKSINGLYMAELLHRRFPWKTREAVELTTLQWVHWFNHTRLLTPIGASRQQRPRQNTGGTSPERPRRWSQLKPTSLHDSRGSSIAVALGETTATVTTLARRFLSAESTVMSDEDPAYASFSKHFACHEAVAHSKAYSRPGGINNNLAESFNARMRRLLEGIYLNISNKYLTDYAADAAWREGVRKLSTGKKRCAPRCGWVCPAGGGATCRDSTGRVGCSWRATLRRRPEAERRAGRLGRRSERYTVQNKQPPQKPSRSVKELIQQASGPHNAPQGNSWGVFYGRGEIAAGG